MSQESALQELYNFLDQQRGARADYEELVLQWVVDRAEGTLPGGLSPELLNAVVTKVGAGRGRRLGLFEAATPPALTRFLVDLIGDGKRRSVLDPACGVGLTLLAAAKACDAEILHGCEINPTVRRIASALTGEKGNIWEGDAISTLAHGEGVLATYDAIVSQPPMGVNVRSSASSDVTRDFGQALAVWASSHLSDGGVAVLVLVGTFPWRKQAIRVKQAIRDNGSRIRAMIHLPSFTMPHAAVESYAVVIERGEQEKVFVGQYTEQPEDREQLLSNYRRKKNGPRPALGRVCALADFRDFEALVAQENLSRLARDCGWKEYAAEAVFPQHEAMREGREEELSEDAQSLYLKLVGKGRASTRSDELRTGKSQKLREVLHLKVDSEIADPPFMTHWFNESRIGRLALDALRGGMIPRIRAKDFLRSRIHLPPISEQRLVVEGAAYLGKVRAETEELESALWSGTEPIEGLVERIQSINQDDHYEDWLETLPFPLASILWRHHASKDSYRHRYEVLLHFFEATAAFLATIHLSAMMEDDEAWEKHGKRLNEKLSRQKLSLDRATFGAWKLVAELLGSACRAMINDGEQTNRWQRIYGTTDLTVMEMISDSEVLGVLQQANKVRNDWQGHSGAISEDTAKSVHDQLVALVDRLRGLFGRNWQRYELIQPDGGPYRQGTHHVTCKRLMGTRSAPFEERVYESRDPLEAGSLYLFDSVHQSGLQLRPFIEVIPSPEKKAVACFIFSRLEDEGARWVSYHFEQESEISHSSQGVEDTLAMLREA